jgi:hypothetical protein
MVGNLTFKYQITKISLKRLCAVFETSPYGIHMQLLYIAN